VAHATVREDGAVARIVGPASSEFEAIELVAVEANRTEAAAEILNALVGLAVRAYPVDGLLRAAVAAGEQFLALQGHAEAERLVFSDGVTVFQRCGSRLR
jgi:hypothetical protein